MAAKSLLSFFQWSRVFWKAANGSLKICLSFKKGMPLLLIKNISSKSLISSNETNSGVFFKRPTWEEFLEYEKKISKSNR